MNIRSLLEKAMLAPDGRWRAIWRFTLAVIIYLLANRGAGWLARFTSTLVMFEALYRPVLAALLLAGFTLLLFVFDRVRARPLAAQGLDTVAPWAREIFLGTLLGAALVSLAVGAIALLGSLRLQTSVNPATLRIALVELWILITAALAEEAAFRGYPFQRLMESLGGAWAIALLSLLFGAIHLGNPHATLWGFLNTVLVGVLLAVAYLRTRRLWLPWGIHFGWNAALGLVFGLPVSGLTEFAVLVQGEAQGPLWLTGGDYGIEASASGAVVIVLGMAAVMWMTAKPLNGDDRDASKRSDSGGVMDEEAHPAQSP